MDAIGHVLTDLWNGLLHLAAQIVTPDWAGLVALIPVALVVLVALFFGWLLRQILRTGPRRRRPRSRAPIPPPGVHAPGPSWAPVLGALGLFAVFFGLVFGGPWLVLGLGVLVVALLYWLREGIRDYERLETPSEALPALAEGGPPPGVHIPAPSFRPILAAGALAVVFYGLVFGGWLLPAGIAVLVIVLAGWLRDARREYVAVEAADRTGHLDAGPPPPYPTTTIVVSLLIVAAAVVLDAGILPPRNAVGGEPGASPAPSLAPSGPPGSPGVSPGPSAAPSIPAADLTITAQGIQFVERQVAAPAGRPFTIAFVNLDAGVPHNVDIRDAGGQNLFVGEIFNGVDVRVYEVPALAAGEYPFVCTVHPNMTGTITAR